MQLAITPAHNFGARNTQTYWQNIVHALKDHKIPVTTVEQTGDYEVTKIVNDIGEYTIVKCGSTLVREDFFSTDDGYSRQYQEGQLLFELRIDYKSGQTEKTEFDSLGRIKHHNRTDGTEMVQDVSYEYFDDYALVINHLMGKRSMRLYPKSVEQRTAS